jgi:hypothetical protein
MYVRPEQGGAYGIKRLGPGPVIGLVLGLTLLAALMVLIPMGVIRYRKRKAKAKSEKERAEVEAAMYQRNKASASIGSSASSSTTSTPPVFRAPSYDTRQQYPLYGSRGYGTDMATPFLPNSHGVQVPPPIHTNRTRRMKVAGQPLPLKGGSIDSLTFAGDLESMIAPDDRNALSTPVMEERRGSPASAGRGSPRSVGKGSPVSSIRSKNRRQGSSLSMPLIVEVEGESIP